jgi:putative ABC transport system permease protein
LKDGRRPNFDMRHDLRYAIRTLARTPGFAAAAVLSLALGIGANSAIFSVASALLLRPLPYRDAGRLVILWNRSPGLGIAEDWFSTAQYFDIRNGQQSFDEVAIVIGANANLTGDGEPERIGTIRVSSNLLPMLGVRPLLGQLFVAEDDVPGAAGRALLGYGTWTRRYGGDPAVVGRSIVLNGQTYKIAGVLPPAFSLRQEVVPTLGVVADAEVVLPLPLPPNAPQIRSREDYNVVAKLKPGATVGRAQAEMDALTARLRGEHPDLYPPNGGLTFSVVPLQEQVVGNVRRSLLILAGAVGFVLLIACANVANLLLSRAVARQREMAIRAAIGASRGRLVRQLLTESVLLALAGGALGLVFAVGSLQGIRILGAKSVPRLHEIAIDPAVLLFTLAVSALSGVIFGLAPALRLGRLNVQRALQDAAGRGVSGAGSLWGRGHGLRRLLVAAELALSVVLLIGAGLLVRSFARLQHVAPGFNADSVLTFELTMTGRKYADAQALTETYRQLWRGLAAVPGVTAAGGVSALPLSQMMSWGPITVEGRTPPPGEKFINADQRVAAAGYFRAMEIPLLRGRLFTDEDTRSTPRVVLVDDFMARQIWPGEDPVGKRIRTGGIDTNVNAPWMTVVGVVGRIKQDTLESDSRIAVYLPHAQFSSRAMNVVVRGGGGSAATLAPVVRAAIRAIDPDLPLYNVRTMASRVDESLARRRFSMLLLTLFAVLALGLATIGVYGVIAYLVSHGTRELGIRMALGATPARILAGVVAHGLAIALAGVGLGLACAFALTRLMRSLLYGVEPSDPLTFLGIALALIAIALIASLVPALRAARIDPIASLRSE